MGPQAEDYIETVLTCEGDYYDPDFHTNLQIFSKKLEELILQDKKKKKLILKKVEPWNSVKVTFNIPKEAALRLKCLAEQGDSTLKELGILAVEIEGDRKISLKIAGKNNETTELIFRTNPAEASAVDLSKVESVASSNISRKNTQDYMAHAEVIPDLAGNAKHTQGSYFVSTTPQVSPKFPTPPPSVSTPNSPSAKGHSVGHMLSPTSQSTMETMVKLLSSKTNVTSPLLVDLLQNDLAGAHNAVFSRALNSVLPQTFNSVVPQTSSTMSFPVDEGISMQPPAKKKRKVRKTKDRDNSKIKKEQETKHVIQNILNQAVSAGVPHQDRVPPIISEQLTSDPSEKGSQHSSRAVTPAKSPVPKSPIQLSLAPGQRHIINPITGQLELVDDDLNTTPPKVDPLHENKGHLLSPKNRSVVPCYSRSPAQYGKQSPAVYDKVVPKSPRSSPPIVSVKNDLRDTNTLATHCDHKTSKVDVSPSSLKAGATSFMQPKTCIISPAFQSTPPKPSVSGHLNFSHVSTVDTSSAISMSQTISAILSNVSKSGGLALATLNPPVHDSLLNAGTPMQTPSGNVVSAVPLHVHSSSLMVNSTSVSNINPSDLLSFPHKDNTPMVDTIRQSQIPSVLMEADSSGDSNTSVTPHSSETQSSTIGLHGIKQTPLHASHKDNTGSSISQVQGAIYVNSVEGPKVNSVHVNSNVSSPPASIGISAPTPSMTLQSCKSVSNDTSSVTAPPTLTSKSNGTSRFMNQVQHKSSGDILNHDSELSSHSSDDHVKQGSIDSGLGLGDMKVNSGESPSGSSGNDSPGIASSSGNRDSDSEKDRERDFSIPDKQNVITIGYVLSKEEHPPTKQDLLDHLEKYSQNNMDPLQKEHPLSVIESDLKSDSGDSFMKLPNLIKLPDIPYSNTGNQILSEKSQVKNSLNQVTHYNSNTKSNMVEENPYELEKIALKTENSRPEKSEVSLGDDRSSMVQVCSNDSEVLKMCNMMGGANVSNQGTLEGNHKANSPVLPTSASNPTSLIEMDHCSTGQSNNSPERKEISYVADTLPVKSEPSNGSTQNINSCSSNVTRSPEAKYIAGMSLKENRDAEQVEETCGGNCVEGGSDTGKAENLVQSPDVSVAKSPLHVVYTESKIPVKNSQMSNHICLQQETGFEVKSPVQSVPVTTAPFVSKETTKTPMQMGSVTTCETSQITNTLPGTSVSLPATLKETGCVQNFNMVQSEQLSGSESAEHVSNNKAKSPEHSAVSRNNTEHAEDGREVTVGDLNTLSVTIESYIPNQLQVSPTAKGPTSSKPLFVPVNSNNNITFSALDKHCPAPLFDRISHQAPILAVNQATPFKGPGNLTSSIKGGLLTAVTSSGQSNTELLVPGSSMLQIPIQPVILHTPLAKGYVISSPASLAVDKVSTESSAVLGKVSLPSSAKVLASGGKQEIADTKYLFSTLATTLNYTQASMSSTAGLGILPMASFTGGKTDGVNPCLPSVMTHSLANIPLFSKCTTTTSLKPGHRAMASLGPSPIMSTGLPYLSTPSSTAPRPVTPPADVTGDGKLPKGAIPKGISIMKPLRDRESNMEEDLMESPIKDKKSPRKLDRTEKAVYHKRGNFTVAQLLDEADKVKQNQALLKPCITSDNNENLSKTFSPVINTTCISHINAHIPKTVNSKVENFVSGSSGSKSVMGLLQTVNLGKTEELSVVLNPSVEASYPMAQPIILNAEIKTVVPHQSLTAIPSECQVSIKSSELDQSEPFSGTSTPMLISPHLVSSAANDTSMVIQASSHASDREIKKSDTQLKDTVLSSEKQPSIMNIDKAENTVKIVAKNSFKGEFLKLGSGTTSDCSNFKIEPAITVKEKSSPPKEESATQGACDVIKVEQSETEPVTSSCNDGIGNSPNRSFDSFSSSASLVHEHSYSVSPHKTTPNNTTKEYTPSGENIHKDSHKSDVDQGHGSVAMEVPGVESSIDGDNMSDGNLSSNSDVQIGSLLSEEIVPDTEHRIDQGNDISKSLISSVNADIGKTLLYVGSTVSKEPTKVTLDLRSAVTHPASFTKFIKLEPGGDWASKSANKLTSNITVKVKNDIGKEAVAAPLVQENQVIDSTSETSCGIANSGESEQNLSRSVQVKSEKVDNLVNDISQDSFPKSPGDIREKAVTSRRKSSSEVNKALIDLEERQKLSRLPSSNSNEFSEDLKPAKITRRASRDSVDSKTSLNENSVKAEDASAGKLNLRARTKQLSENSESGTLCTELALERSISPNPNQTKSVRSSRRKDKSQDLTEQADSLQSRSTRSSKRKHPINDDREDADQTKKVKVENCTAEVMVEEKESSPDGDKKPRGRVARNKGTALDPDTEVHDKPEERESAAYKRSTRSAHSVEHCELPNNYTTKKKQKSH